MITSIRQMLPLLALSALPASGQIAGYEYWMDNDYDAKVEVRTSDGNIRQEVDVSSLAPGIHRFQFRAGDEQGRWSSPLCRLFLCLGPDYKDNEAAVCRYAIDDGEWTETDINNGTVNIEIPASGLAQGMHRLMLRVGDGVERWSSVTVRNFLCLGPDYSLNKTSRYEYWIDGDIDRRVTGVTADGKVQIELQTADMCYGLHHVTLRVEDEAGRWSSPFTRCFVKPEPSLAGNMISSYEYWFNRGAVTRVEVGPANPFTADDLLIEVRDVVPNDIDDDYTVDWDEMTAYTADDVVFGIRYGDTAGRMSEARTDTFAYNVPVRLDVTRLVWGDTVSVAGPEAGRIYAYDVEAEAGDSLTWCTSGPCKMDIYAGTGERLARIDSPAMPVEHKMKAVSAGRVLALVYGVPSDTLSVCCNRKETSGITFAGSGVEICAGDGKITVVGASGRRCSLYSVQGYVVDRRLCMGETETFDVSGGVYVIVLTDDSGNTCRQTIAVKGR